MAHITYFQRYSTYENVVTNTTLHLFSQINQHSPDRLRTVLSELFGDVEMPLGINFQQQTRSESSVPDGSILQEPVHIIIETKVDAGVSADQLIRHCERFVKGRTGNYLMLLTKNEASPKNLEPVRRKAKDMGVVFQDVTFEKLCVTLQNLAKEYETHLVRIIEDYKAYCSDMELLPDRRKLLRIVPCGKTFDLNEKWHVYYQPTDRSYSNHEYIGIYNQKSVRLVGKVAAIYDNYIDKAGKMQLKLFSGEDRSEFHERIIGMVDDSKQKVGWEIDSDTRFFCVDKFQHTNFEKISSGGIQGPRFWDISDFVKNAPSDFELANLLCKQRWS